MLKHRKYQITLLCTCPCACFPCFHAFYLVALLFALLFALITHKRVSVSCFFMPSISSHCSSHHFFLSLTVSLLIDYSASDIPLFEPSSIWCLNYNVMSEKGGGALLYWVPPTLKVGGGARAPLPPVSDAYGGLQLILGEKCCCKSNIRCLWNVNAKLAQRRKRRIGKRRIGKRRTGS